MMAQCPVTRLTCQYITVSLILVYQYLPLFIVKCGSWRLMKFNLQFLTLAQPSLANHIDMGFC